MNPVKYKQRLAKYPDEKKNLKLDIVNGFIGFDCKGRHLVLVICSLHSVGGCGWWSQDGSFFLPLLVVISF